MGLDTKNIFRELLFRLGFLDAPKDVERRQHTRHECSFPVTLKAGDRTYTAVARDISLGGMLIDRADLPDGVIRVRAEFKLPPEVMAQGGIPRSVSMGATVRGRNPATGAVSLSFSESLRPPARSRLSIDHWIGIMMVLAVAGLVPASFYFHPLAKYVAVWLTGFTTTLVLTPLVRGLMRRLGAVDVPDERRAHSTPTPRGGGLAVVIGFFAAASLALLYPWEWSAGSLNAEWLYRYLAAATVLVVVGLADDLIGLRPVVKLSGQVAAAALMFHLGEGMGRLMGFSLPWYFDLLATLLWFLALTNAFNLIDGLDGLAAGLAVVAGLGLIGAFFIRRVPSDAVVVLGLVGACVAFLRYNFHPASVFLGDTGSMFLGFTFAAIALATGSKGTFMASLGVPLLAVGIPVFDTILAIWRRSMRALVTTPGQARRGLMQPDAEHLHHRLRKKGLGQYQIAVFLYVINATLVVVGLLSLAFRDHALGIFLVAFVAGVYVVIRHLAEVELWDTGQAIIRGLGRPHQGVAAFFFYPLLDLVCLIASLALALFIIQLLTPVERLWEVWITSVPIWVAPTFILFCAGRLYSRVWSRARAGDYLALSTALLTGVLLSVGISALLDAGHWPRYLVMAFIFTGLSHVTLVGSRFFVRGLADALALWNEVHYYRRGGVVRRVLLYGAGGRYLLFLNERSMNNYQPNTRRMIVGLIDDDPNLRYRRVAGYVVLGTGAELPGLLKRMRVDEVVITAQLRDEALEALVALCGLNGIRLSEWHYEERDLTTGEPSAPSDME